MKNYISLLDLLCLFIIFLMIFICPFTKVEESFNLQATHDLLYYKTNLSKYDHFEFPGVVPRTFVGPFILALFSFPFYFLIHLFSFSKIYSLYIVRMILGCFLVWSLSQFRKQISISFDKQISTMFMIITICQFHLLFYMSRTLPNIFALFIVILGYTYWFKRDYKITAFLFTVTIIMFRSEVISLIGPIMLEALIRREISFYNMIKWGIISTIIALSICISIDSIMWEPWMWSEGVVFYYNAILGKSVNWGTSPFYWYFTSAIPKSMMFTIFFIPFSLLNSKVNRILRPILLFIILYSLLPHKELRFIFYVFPILNIASAVGFVNIYRRIYKGGIYKLILFCMILCIIANIICSGCLLYISSTNYPGGEAFNILHKDFSSNKNYNIHIDVAAAQTGVSRFGELNSNWKYSKEENITSYDDYDILITEKQYIPGYKIHSEINGFTRLDIKNYNIIRENNIYIQIKQNNQ